MKNINLLPPEKKPADAIVKFSKILKEISTISLIIFFVTVGVISALYFTMSARIKSEKSKEDKFVNEIESLEQTEQQLVFIKDRIRKINSLIGNEDTQDELIVLNEITGSLPSGVFFEGSELSPDQTVITLLAGNSSDLGKFLNQLISSNYSEIELLGFSYKPEAGYEVKFGIKI